MIIAYRYNMGLSALMCAAGPLSIADKLEGSDEYYRNKTDEDGIL